MESADNPISTFREEGISLTIESQRQWIRALSRRYGALQLLEKGWNLSYTLSSAFSHFLKAFIAFFSCSFRI